jgi:hypothetical protein
MGIYIVLEVQTEIVSLTIGKSKHETEVWKLLNCILIQISGSKIQNLKTCMTVPFQIHPYLRIEFQVLPKLFSWYNIIWLNRLN